MIIIQLIQLKLLKYFINIEAIKEASVEELRKAGMPINLANVIYDYFHNEE